MCAPDKQREPDRVGVFLERRFGDLTRRLEQAGVDDLEAGVAQRPGDHLGATIVSVQPGLGNDDAVASQHSLSCRGRRERHVSQGLAARPEGSAPRQRTRRAARPQAQGRHQGARRRDVAVLLVGFFIAGAMIVTTRGGSGIAVRAAQHRPRDRRAQQPRERSVLPDRRRRAAASGSRSTTTTSSRTRSMQPSGCTAEAGSSTTGSAAAATVPAQRPRAVPREHPDACTASTSRDREPRHAGDRPTTSRPTQPTVVARVSDSA